MKNVLAHKRNNLALAEIKPLYIKTIIDRATERLKGFAERLEGVSVESVLKRGFAWVKGENNQTIYSVADAKKQTALAVRFADGEIVLGANKPDETSAKKQKKSEKEQGSLFDF